MSDDLRPVIDEDDCSVDNNAELISSLVALIKVVE